MAYKDFEGDLDRCRAAFDLTFEKDDLFAAVQEVEPSQWLQTSLELASDLYLRREKSRSEFLVAPVLLEAKRATNERFAIYSGEFLNADFNAGLNGECDFILTKTQQLPVLSAPIMTLVEAKNQDIDAGLGQCAAQMLGARIFNEKAGITFSPIFGCVTTGENWQFLKLENNRLTFDNRRYYIDRVGKILGVFQAIVAHYEN